jgi:hypothetical protein
MTFPASKKTARARVQPNPDPTTTRTKAGVPRGSRAVGPRPGTKTAKVLALLQRTQGASLKELRKATGWQPHSIRGFLSGTVGRRMGLKIRSIKTESGERRYWVMA